MAQVKVLRLFYVMSGLLPWLMNPIGSALNLFNTSNDGGSTIWNHSNGYSVNSFTQKGNDNAGNFGLDPDGYVSSIWNDVMGFTSQSREFSQQEYLQDKMNDYNSPVNQMARLKAAGINPNTAAAGVAQGGNESVQAPQVSSNTQGVSQGVASAVGAISGIGSMPATIANLYAQSKEHEANANETNSLLGIKQGLYRAQTFHELMAGGLDEANARAVEIENQYRGDSLLLDLEAKRLNLPILRQTFTNLQKEYDVKCKEIERMDQEISESSSRISLNEKLGLVALREAKSLELSNWYQGRINDIMAANNYDPRWATDNILFSIGTNPNISIDDAVGKVDKMCGILYKSSYNQSLGHFGGQYPFEKSLEYIKGDVERSNIESKSNADIKVNQENRKGNFWNSTINKWLRVPSSAGVGPFKMSTE